jgi:hypothetical protein
MKTLRARGALAAAATLSALTALAGCGASPGRVADGYGVQDQPWLALVSASGKIIWSHDGWLPVAALTAAVQHALKRGR